MKIRIYSYVLPICLAMSAVSPGFSDSTETLLQICSLLLLLSVGLALAGKQFIEPTLYTQSSISGLLVLFFLFSATVSSMGAEDTAQSLLLVAGIAVCIVVSGGAWSTSEKEVKDGLVRYCVAATSVMLVLWLRNRETGHRFGELVHPNYWGLLCFCSFCLAGLVRNTYLALSIRIISILIILDAQARGALLSTAIAAGVVAYFRLRTSRLKTDVRAGIVMCTVALLLASSLIFKERLYDTFTQLFLLNDPFRGGSTGFSGRTEIWRAGIDLFKAHPFFGVGAGMQKYFITGFGEVNHAHNGYLNILDQFGAVGGGLFLLLAGASVRKLGKLACLPTSGSSVGIALVAGYAVGAIFDPKLLNIGNPVSIVFLMFLLQPLPSKGRRAALRRPTRALRPAKQLSIRFRPAEMGRAERAWESQIK